MGLFGLKVLKVEKDILNIENDILSKKVISFKRKVNSDNEYFVLLFNYLDEKIPAKEEYTDIDTIKKSVGYTYRFNGESIELAGADCKFSLDNNNEVWLDIGLNDENRLGKLKEKDEKYFTYLCKQSFKLNITVDKGIYKVFDRLHDKLLIKDAEVTLKLDLIPE